MNNKRTKQKPLSKQNNRVALEFNVLSASAKIKSVCRTAPFRQRKTFLFTTTFSSNNVTFTWKFVMYPEKLLVYLYGVP